ncbi:hypothetical protein PR048_012588 [Dryococelus australis]|uniref:Uncharacterized protein n=1 Tax=Dryococelus australis TaxID=614101 RepID=A0ABQ9HPW4_9NEOP|nr:hypothetical protein PR048_012588 [Dryococelus australis]
MYTVSSNGEEEEFCVRPNVSSAARPLRIVQVAQGRGIGEGIGDGLCKGKPWVTETGMAEPGIEPGSSRMRVQIVTLTWTSPKFPEWLQITKMHVITDGPSRILVLVVPTTSGAVSRKDAEMERMPLTVRVAMHANMKVDIAGSAQHSRHSAVITAMLCSLEVIACIDISRSAKEMFVHRRASASIVARHSLSALMPDVMKRDTVHLSASTRPTHIITKVVDHLHYPCQWEVSNNDSVRDDVHYEHLCRCKWPKADIHHADARAFVSVLLLCCELRYKKIEEQMEWEDKWRRRRRSGNNQNTHIHFCSRKFNCEPPLGAPHQGTRKTAQCFPTRGKPQLLAPNIRTKVPQSRTHLLHRLLVHSSATSYLGMKIVDNSPQASRCSLATAARPLKPLLLRNLLQNHLYTHLHIYLRNLLHLLELLDFLHLLAIYPDAWSIMPFTEPLCC